MRLKYIFKALKRVLTYFFIVCGIIFVSGLFHEYIHIGDFPNSTSICWDLDNYDQNGQRLFMHIEPLVSIDQMDKVIKSEWKAYFYQSIFMLFFLVMYYIELEYERIKE